MRTHTRNGAKNKRVIILRSSAVSQRAQAQQKNKEFLQGSLKKARSGPSPPSAGQLLTYLGGVLDETDRLQLQWTFYTVSGVCLSKGRRCMDGGVSPPYPHPKKRKKILSRGGLNRKFNGHLLGGGDNLCPCTQHYVTSLA